MGSISDLRYYTSDTQVFTEVLNTLDDPTGSYNINFKQYDNWEFMRGNIFFNHYYQPGVGDGYVDQIWIINRDTLISRLWAEKSLEGTYFTTNDGVTINSTSGSRISMAKNIITPWAVSGPAHEYCHYLFGGSQVSGHFDGRSYNNYSNEGRINSFALMCAVNNGYMCAYERYRLGWLNPDIISSNANSFVLDDTHVKNKAIIIPLRYDASTGWLKEYYFIENYETRNEYSRANPFLISERFNHTLTRGLLLYHIKDEDFNTATNSDISIVNADGRYSWRLIQGASTPYDRSDDLIGKDFPTYHSDYDYRDYITMNVGGVVTYNDYACLIHHKVSDPDGWRYNSDDFLGTEKDFFNNDFNNVFSKFSNPAAYLGDDITTTNTGFQILGFDSQTKAYNLSIQVDYNGILSLAPSKPQNLKILKGIYDPNLNKYLIRLSWDANTEPDLSLYEVWRKVDSGSWNLIGTFSTNSYDDYDYFWGGSAYLYYKVRAKDTENKYSIYSDEASGTGSIAPKIGINTSSTSPNEFSLSQNYPSPFNPSTVIKYSLPYQSEVEISIYDIMGKKVKSLTSQVQPAGYQSVIWNGTNEYGELVSSGVYIYRFRAVSLEGNGKSFEKSSKLMLIK